LRSGLRRSDERRLRPAGVDASLPPGRQSDAHLERAVKLLSFLRMEQARSAIDQAVAANPSNAAALLMRARFALGNDLAAAEPDLNAGLLLSPRNSNLLATRAYVLSHQDVPEALRNANAAVRADRRNVDALWIRSRILFDLGQLEAADDDLNRAVEIEPDAMQPRQARAWLRLTMGRYREAIEDATAVLAQRPSHSMALQARAIARLAVGENEVAIDDLSRILGEPGTPMTAHPSMPRFRRLFLQRAVLLSRVGRKQEAMRDIDAVVALGGPAALLAIQLHLRKNGFADVPLDGKRSQQLDDAAEACFVDEACGRGIALAH
jgi:tetratricopeptide (TPR) repeat protein